MVQKTIVTLIFVATLAGGAAADVVFLKGGQRLEGELTEIKNGYEIKTEYGSWLLPKEEIVRVVKSVDKIVAECEELHKQARALYDEGLKLENDSKTANAKLRAGIELLRKITNLYNEALETYPDPKYGHLSKTLITIIQEMRLYRDKMHSELASDHAPAKSAPVAPPPAAVKSSAPVDPAVLLPRAMAGDVEAQYALGAWHDDKTWLSEEGQKWLRSAAEKNHARALYRVGALYARGKGVKQDYKEAQKWFARADTAGSSLARWALGVLEWQGALAPRSLEKAYGWCEKGAEPLRVEADGGDAEALMALGWMYQEGMGRVIDARKALDSYTEAASLGYAPAQNLLGELHLEGHGVDKNRGEAEKLFTRAAERGDAEAQVNLGELFDEYTGYKNEGTKDFRRAQQWYQKAADQGHGRGCYRLGLIHLDGKGVAKNPGEALRLFQLALRYGTQDYLKTLLNDLGYLYDRGVGVKADFQESLKYYRAAADLGSPEAQYNLGTISLEKRNEKDACKWYLMSARNGHILAQNNLGAFYAQGRAVKKNLEEAEKWFLMAAQKGDPSAVENLKRLQKERGTKK